MTLLGRSMVVKQRGMIFMPGLNIVKRSKTNITQQ